MADIVYPGQTPAAVLGADLLPQNLDLVIWRGDFVDITVQINADGQPMDLTGQTAQAQIKETFSSTESIALTCTIVDSTKVNLYLPTASSRLLTKSSYVWDFQLTKSNGDERTYFAGDVTVHEEVTK